jgi:hypothetical protein
MGKENKEELEEEKEDKKKPKLNNTLIATTAVVGFMFGFFMFGWMLGIMRGYREVNQMVQNNTVENENITEDTEINVIQNDDIKVTDQFAINTYGGNFKYYIISDGKVYYRLENSNFAGLNVCPSTGDYCEYNSTYNNKVTEIKEIENAIRIKTVVDVRASGERFIYFVITDNKVYQLSETMDANGLTVVKVTAIDELANKNIVDLIDIKDRKYIFVTSSGEQIEY